jgi:hypothetical protein
MKKIIFLVFCFVSINGFAQQSFKYGDKANSIYTFSGTLLSAYTDIDVDGGYTDTVKIYYNIEADSLVLYTVNTIKGLPAYTIYRKALAVKDITLDNATQLEKDSDRELFLYCFKIVSKEDDLMKGTTYSYDRIEQYTGNYLYFAFSKENKAFGEKTLELFKELFGK